MIPEKNRRLLLISHHNSYRIAPYISAAINLGLEVTIASEGKHSLVTEVARGIHIRFDDIDSALKIIIEEHNKHPFSGVLGSDDQTVEIAALAARFLHLPHNPPQAARFSQRKDLARARLSLSCPIPMHRLIDFNLPLRKQITGLPWPCVLKPLSMSASRGVIRANDIEEFTKACERIKYIISTVDDTFERNHILVEEYIDGIEIAYEGYLKEGQLETITIFDKPDPLNGPYFEETIYLTPSTLPESLQQSIRSVIQRACSAYGLSTGVIHAECRIDKDEKIWILEIATRTIGGDCARMLDNDRFNVESLAVSLATSLPVNVTKPDQARGVMMIPVRNKGLLKRVEGLLKANKINNIDKIDIIIQEGHELIPLPEGNQYLGYIFASAETTDKVESVIRAAYEELKFITSPVFTIN